MHLSPILMEETRRSLLNPRLRTAYGHSEAEVTAWCEELCRTARIVSDPLPDIGPACRDPNDDHVLAAAVVARAALIVTGDKDLLSLGEFQGVRILTAQAFLEETS